MLSGIANANAARDYPAVFIRLDIKFLANQLVSSRSSLLDLECQPVESGINAVDDKRGSHYIQHCTFDARQLDQFPVSKFVSRLLVSGVILTKSLTRPCLTRKVDRVNDPS